MGQKKCIFHLPFEPDPINRPSGTNIRPGKMLQGFKDLGYDVFEIIGESNHRARRIKEAKRMIDSGVSFEFVYSESETMPTMLTDRDHLPRHPFLDFSFLRYCRKHGIPVGLFYRDAYWLSEEYAHIRKGIKGHISAPLFRYDFMQYRSAVDVLFIPSEEFSGLFQNGLKEFRTYALPSGTVIHDSRQGSNASVSREATPLRLVYVGCITIDDAYDMTMLLDAIREIDDVHLDLCIRENEWESVKDYYRQYIDERVNVVHLKGEEMQQLLDNADVGLLFFKPSQYRGLCMPVKMFEYIEHGLPIVSLSKTAAGRFIEQNECGWMVDYSKKSLVDLIQYLVHNPAEVALKKKNCEIATVRNTWAERAAEVSNLLSGLNSKSARSL